MMRTSAADRIGAFSEMYAPAEDYDYWVRLMKSWKATNLARVLTKYRIHDQQTSFIGREHQIKSIIEIQKKILEKLGIEPTESEWKIHLGLGIGWAKGISEPQLEACICWLDRLNQANSERQVFNQRAFQKSISHRQSLALQTTSPRLRRQLSIKLSGMIR
jgi:hypothetical protein